MSGYKHRECAICGTEIGFSEEAEKLPSGLFRCAGCGFDSTMADTLERLADENAELREALGHYANKSHWDESGVFGTKHDLYLGSRDCHGDSHGYEQAQAVLDKHKQAKSHG